MICQKQQQNIKKIDKRIKQTLKNNSNLEFMNNLNLRNCKMDQIPLSVSLRLPAISRFSLLDKLDLSEMGLKSLGNLPIFPTLRYLDLTMNYICDEEILNILKYENLVLLYMTENRIRSFATIFSLQQLGNLKQLDVSQNPFQLKFQNREEYHHEVFRQFPKLKIMNRFLRNGGDAEGALRRIQQSWFDDNNEQKQTDLLDDNIQEYEIMEVKQLRQRNFVIQMIGERNLALQRDQEDSVSHSYTYSSYEQNSDDREISQDSSFQDNPQND